MPIRDGKLGEVTCGVKPRLHVDCSILNRLRTEVLTSQLTHWLCHVRLCLYMEPVPDDVYISPLLLCCQARVNVDLSLLPLPIYCAEPRLGVEGMLEKEGGKKKEQLPLCS